MAQKRINRCTSTVPYSYFVVPQKDILGRIDQNWVRLSVVKSLKTWERISKYDYRTYIVLNTWEGGTREVCLFDIKTDIEKIKGELRCAR